MQTDDSKFELAGEQRMELIRELIRMTSSYLVSSIGFAITSYALSPSYA